MAQLDRQDNGNIKLTLTLPWLEVQKVFEKELEEAVNNTELPGFRKGKAPRELVEKKLDRNHLYSHSIQHILPDAYAKALKEHDLKPIVYPQIQLVQGEEGKDWVFTAITCEAPQISLPKDYVQEITQISPEPKDDHLSRIVEHLKSKFTPKVPDLLVEEEANHRLAALVENLTKLGVTTESYLQTKKLTPETLKAQYASEARIDLEIEFILSQITKDQNHKNRKETLDWLLSLSQSNKEASVSKS